MPRRAPRTRDAPVAGDGQLEGAAEGGAVEDADHRHRAAGDGPRGLPEAALALPAGRRPAPRRSARPGRARPRSGARRRRASSTTARRSPRGGPPVGSPGHRGSRRRGRWRGSRWRSGRSARRRPPRPGGGRRAGGSQLASVTVMGAGAVGTVLRGPARPRRPRRGPGRAGRPPRRARGGGPRRGARGGRHAVGRAGARARRRPRARAPDLVIVTTKSHHTLAAARALAPVVGPRHDGDVAPERGGERRPASRRSFGAERVLGGDRLRRPAASRSRASVDHEAEGWVKMGDPAGLTERGDAGSTRCSRPAWDVALSERIVHDQWHKLLWNAGFNAICAVTGATAGEALATPGLGGAGARRRCGRSWPSPRATA